MVSSLYSGQQSEGGRGELDGLRRAAAAAGTVSGRAAGAHHDAAETSGAAGQRSDQRPGARAQHPEEEEQRAGRTRSDTGQGALSTGQHSKFPLN